MQGKWDSLLTWFHVAVTLAQSIFHFLKSLFRESSHSKLQCLHGAPDTGDWQMLKDTY